MALYFGELLWRHNPGHSILNTLVYLALAIITVSVVFGRLYTGMVRRSADEETSDADRSLLSQHSMVDITVGSVMGVLCWLGYWLLEDIVESFTITSGWLGACCSACIYKYSSDVPSSSDHHHDPRDPLPRLCASRPRRGLSVLRRRRSIPIRRRRLGHWAQLVSYQLFRVDRGSRLRLAVERQCLGSGRVGEAFDR